MYSTGLVIPEIIVSLLVVASGLYTVWRGWKLLKFPAQATPPATYRLAIWLRHVVQGEQAAKGLRVELMKPARQRQSGIYALIVGCILLISGTGQVVMWFLGNR